MLHSQRTDCGGHYGWLIQGPFTNPFPLPFSAKGIGKLKHTPFQTSLPTIMNIVGYTEMLKEYSKDGLLFFLPKTLT